MSSPNLTDLLDATSKLTDWYSLGVFLKIPSEELQDIDRRLSREGIRRCKIELFTSWMKRYPNASSWTEIALALEKCDENETADRIRQCHLPPSVPATASMPPTSQEREEQQSSGSAAAKIVRVEREKVAAFNNLESSYAQLMLNLKTSLDDKQVPLLKLGRYLIDLLEEDNKLLQATTIDDLFQLISAYYCFLNTAVLKAIILSFIGEPLKHQLELYERQLEQFKETTSMALLKELGPQYSPSVGAPQVTIKLTRCWQPVTIKRFQRLVEQIFEEHFTSLANITVKTGCISVTWLARRSAIPSLIAHAQDKTVFMRLVGVLRVSIAGIDILEQEEEEDTFLSLALVLATWRDSVDAVELLLGLGADPNSYDSDGDIPLMIACIHGNIRIANLLLQAHANINQQKNNGFTALMYACSSETPDIDLVKLLIQYGADISIRSGEQRTALMYATQHGHTGIVQYLLDSGAPVNTQDVDGFTLLMIAIMKAAEGHPEIVHFLLNYGPDVNILNDHDITALMLACALQITVYVDLLLANGADPNLCGREYTPLIAACIKDDITYNFGFQMDPSILDKLLSAGANPNTQNAEHGHTALMTAALHGYERGVQVLINASADVNIQDSDGKTALHYAAKEGHLAVCKLLLASGAQASVTNSDGNTPLDDALNNNHHEVCELLRSRMDSDPPITTPKPQPDKTRRPTIKPRRGILPSITSLGRYFNKLLLPDRKIKYRHSSKTAQGSSTTSN